MRKLILFTVTFLFFENCLYQLNHVSKQSDSESTWTETSAQPSNQATDRKKK